MILFFLFPMQFFQFWNFAKFSRVIAEIIERSNLESYEEASAGNAERNLHAYRCVITCDGHCILVRIFTWLAAAINYLNEDPDTREDTRSAIAGRRCAS